MSRLISGATKPAIKSRGGQAELSALTSLRFFASLYVVLFHYAYLFFDADTVFHSGEVGTFISFGYSSVTFFFLLSGFILAYNYHNTNFSDTSAI